MEKSADIPAGLIEPRLNDGVDERTVSLLSKGLITLFEPDLLKANKMLSELLTKQSNVQRQLSEETQNLDHTKLDQIQKMMEELKLYKNKLIAIRKNMKLIHTKARSLKKRASEIEEFKEKQLASKIQKRRQEESLISQSTTE